MKSKEDKEFWNNYIDSYYDYVADLYRKDLNHPDEKKRKMAEHMVKSMEDAKTWEYTAVKDPFMKGHTIVVKHKRGEARPLTWEEERYNNLSLADKALLLIRRLRK